MRLSTMHRLVIRWLLGLVAIWGGVRLQAAAIDVTNSSTSGYTILYKAYTTTYLSDAPSDQQTGQSADDFVGDSTYAAFMVAAGTVGGVDSMVFRVRMDTLYTKNNSGAVYTSTMHIGIDANADGVIDLVFGPDGNGNTKNTIVFQKPGSGANDGPSTTSWATVMPQYSIAFDSTNFSYMATGDGSNFNGTTDAYVTFSVPFATLQAAIYTSSGITITQNTFLRYVAFTSTQNNSINQDLLGAGTITNGVTFADLGAFTEYTNGHGTLIPELSTGVQVMVMMLGAGFLGLRRKPHASRRMAVLRVPSVDPITA